MIPRIPIRPRLLGLLLLVLALSLPALAQQAPPPTLTAGHITFQYDDDTRGVTEFLARNADAHTRRLMMRLRMEETEPITVVLASSAEEFQEANPGRVPHWAAGTAWPKRGYIVLRTHSGTTDPAALERRLVHEITHVLVQRAAGDGFVPHWLTEGLAQAESGQSLWERSRNLFGASVTGNVLPLSKITWGWPNDASRARLAYAQSIALIAWIERENGPDAVPTLLRELRQGADLDAALVAGTGRNLAALEKAFADRLTWVHAWLPLIGSSGTVWVLTVFLFLGAYAKKRRKHREALERMEAEESAWRGPPESKSLDSLWVGSAFRDPTTGQLKGPDGTPWSEQ